MDFPLLGRRVLDEALGLGAESAEVFAKTGRSTDITLHQGKIESVATAEEEGLGVRFRLPRGRAGYCYTADLSPASVRQLLEEAFRGVEESDDGTETAGLPAEPPADAPDEEALGIWSPEMPATPLGRKVEFLRAMEAAVLQADRRVTWVDTLLYHDGWTEVHLANTLGFLASYRQSLACVVLHILARHEEEAMTSHHVEAACSLGLLDPDAIGREAGIRATAPLGGRSIGPRRAPVVLDAPVASRILESLAPSFLGRAYRRGRSLFGGRLGGRIGPASVTIVDDGRRAGGLSSAPFDGEGTATRRTAVVEEGVLRRLLHDRSSAAVEEGAASTGNCMRSSYRDRPHPGVSNLMVLPGPRPTAEVLLDLDQGFHVLNLAGAGGVNPVTGAFSAAASGVWVESGKEMHAVSGVTLSGDLKGLLEGVVAVGDDPAWHHGEGSCSSPTLVVEGLTLAG